MKRVSLLAASVTAALAFQATQAQNSVDLTVTAEVIESCEVTSGDSINLDFGTLQQSTDDPSRLADGDVFASADFDVLCSNELQLRLSADAGDNFDGECRRMVNTDEPGALLRYGISIEDSEQAVVINANNDGFWGWDDIGETPTRTIAAEGTTITVNGRISQVPWADAGDFAWSPGTYVDNVVIGLHID